MAARSLTLPAAAALVALACGPTQKVDKVPEPSGDDATASAAPSDGGGDTSALSEGEKTRLMQQRADDLVQKYHDAQATATTAEERVKAYQEFEKGRQELDQSADGGAPPPPAADDEYAPPPVP